MSLSATNLKPARTAQNALPLWTVAGAWTDLEKFAWHKVLKFEIQEQQVCSEFGLQSVGFEFTPI